MSKRTATTRVKRRLNKELLRQWLKDNEPKAAGEPSAKDKLIQACGYAFSVYTLDKILWTGTAPKVGNRLKIANAIGVPVDEIFPEAKRKNA